MKYLGYCLAGIALFLVVKLVAIGAGLATGYYLHTRTPRPHVTMKYLERAAEPQSVTLEHRELRDELPLACTAAPSAEIPPVGR